MTRWLNSAVVGETGVQVEVDIRSYTPQTHTSSEQDLRILRHWLKDLKLINLGGKLVLLLLNCFRIFLGKGSGIHK